MPKGAMCLSRCLGSPRQRPAARDWLIISGTFFFFLGVSDTRCMTTESRFGRIVHINGEDERVHVQWFDHASNTFLDDIADPRELFLTPLCDTLPLITLCGTVPVADMSRVTAVRDDFDGYFFR